MIFIHKPVQALIDAAPQGWTRVLPTFGRSHWSHANGLQLLVQRSRMPSGARTWTCFFNLQSPGEAVTPVRPDDADWSLRIPRTYVGSLGTTMRPLWTDLSAWIAGLDVQPLRHIAVQIAAWRWIHHRNAPYIFVLNAKEPDIVLIRDANLLRNEMIHAPAALIDLLRADIQAVWARDHSPKPTDHTVVWMPGRRHPDENRRATVTKGLPQTLHEGLHLLAQARPELRHIPWPDPL